MTFSRGQVIPAQDLEVEKVEPFEQPSISLSRVTGKIAWRPIARGPAGVVRSLRDYAYVKETQQRRFRQIGVEAELRYVRDGQEQVLWQGKMGTPKLKWSNAGDKIAFVGYVNGKRGIRVHDLTSHENYVIEPQEGGLVSAAWAWSPDGEFIAYSVQLYVPDQRYPGSRRAVHQTYICKYDGSDCQEWGEGSVAGWSAVDAQLIVSRGEEVPNTTSYTGFVVAPFLWLIDVKRGIERKLPLPSTAAPLLSPTGLEFYFKIRGRYDINIFNIEQDQFISVELDFENGRHTWSPDGSKIAFTGYESQPMPGKPHELEYVNSDIWVVNADGTGLTQLTQTGSGTFERKPRWIDNTTLLVEKKNR